MSFLLDTCLLPNDDRYRTNERYQLWQVAENQAIGSNLQLVFMPSLVVTLESYDGIVLDIILRRNDKTWAK